MYWPLKAKSNRTPHNDSSMAAQLLASDITTRWTTFPRS
jgi:hypothetical protein